jgi:hypothetical protein
LICSELTLFIHKFQYKTGELTTNQRASLIILIIIINLFLELTTPQEFNLTSDDIDQETIRTLRCKKVDVANEVMNLNSQLNFANMTCNLEKNALMKVSLSIFIFNLFVSIYFFHYCYYSCLSLVFFFLRMESDVK